MQIIRTLIPLLVYPANKLDPIERETEHMVIVNMSVSPGPLLTSSGILLKYPADCNLPQYLAGARDLALCPELLCHWIWGSYWSTLSQPWACLGSEYSLREFWGQG